jgi:hypothetical protein
MHHSSSPQRTDNGLTDPEAKLNIPVLGNIITNLGLEREVLAVGKSRRGHLRLE